MPIRKTREAKGFIDYSNQDNPIQIACRFTPDDFAFLKEMADYANVGVSEAIRRCVKTYRESL